MDFEYLRNQLIGADAQISTPFGERLMVYGDYTASGRCLALVERYLQNLQRIYANTHTEDDITGRSMTNLLEEAEHHIKVSVNAGPNGRIISCGTGAARCGRGANSRAGCIRRAAPTSFQANRSTT